MESVQSLSPFKSIPADLRACCHAWLYPGDGLGILGSGGWGRLGKEAWVRQPQSTCAQGLER